LPVNADGLIDVNDLEAAITPKTILIVVMAANNEIGVLQPIREIGRIARKHGILFFTDGAQAVGKIPVDVNRDGIDLLSLSGHKIYGPKGVGALYVRRKNPRVKLVAQIDGGGHERGLRSGTLNVTGIVGLGMACELCLIDMENESKRLTILREKLEKGLLELEDSHVNGSRDHRLPNVTNMSFKCVDANSLMMSVGKDIAISSGSACTSASIEPSYVLKALGLTDDLAHASVRFTLGRFTTEEEVDYAITRVMAAVNNLRINNLHWEKYKKEKLMP
jgi:cysteine desulfurase